MDLSSHLLYTREGLQDIDRAFLSFLQEESFDLYEVYERIRRGAPLKNPQEESKILLELAPFLELFLSHLFSIEDPVLSVQKSLSDLAPLFQCRRLFVQRRAVKKYSSLDTQFFEGEALESAVLDFLETATFDPLIFSQKVLLWLKNPDPHSKALEICEKYAAWRTFRKKDPPLTLEGQLFHVPSFVDFKNLIPTVEGKEGEKRIPEDFLKNREGFNLTDTGKNTPYACGEAHYCIFCHNQGKDSCSKGFLSKEKEEVFQKNPLGIELKGCPLKQKISEMNVLVTQGYMLGALAMIVIDNPLVAATGARICNDCMRSCIYQKQEAVDIPSIETEILKSVLDLPFGFEIYSLLTRWNPLNFKNVLPKKATTSHKILVVGMGPAGFTLSHYLLNEGHAVVGIDGLKIEPLPSSLAGTSGKQDFPLIKNIGSLYSDLSHRAIGGFGGVMEYGITSRWNKNYLLIIRLLLERRENFKVFGSVRFGGVFNEDYAARLGFNHISLCLGAGAPRLLGLKHSLAKGIRQASDFLMTLQLTGASQEKSLTNLVMRLPLVVVGGGLTAVDAATEAQAYYKIQVEKFLKKYEQLVTKKGKDRVEARWTKEDREIAQEFISHARILREEKERARREKREPHFQKLIQEWGGVHMIYRRSLQESPAYRYNFEELKKALEEGVGFMENLSLQAIHVDSNGWVESGLFERKDGSLFSFPLKSLLVAHGTRPNTTLAEGGEISLPLKQGNLISIPPSDFEETEVYAPVICQKGDHHQPSLSFLGDLNPAFSGSVVKAMASAKEGAPFICQTLKPMASLEAKCPQEFFEKIGELFEACVEDIQEISPNILELTVHAPFAAETFRPGQFFRLQRFDKESPLKNDTRFSMEPIALTALSACKSKGNLSFIVKEIGASTNLCRLLKRGEKISLMGPSGAPTKIPAHKTCLLIGEGIGSALLFSIARILRKNGCRILYVAGGYFSMDQRFKIQEIEEASDSVLWCCEHLEAEEIALKRPQDFIFQGSVVEGLISYGKGELGPVSICLQDIQYVLTMGSASMMEAVAKAQKNALSPFLSSVEKAYGSINSPMQCMMKGICAQCLQTQKDACTGVETVVFSCVQQDQELENVDFLCLKNRLGQNHVMEDLAHQWEEFSGIL